MGLVRRAAVVAGLALLGCESGEDLPIKPPPPPPAPAPGIMAISVGPAGRTIAVGDTLRFTATATTGSITGFTWAVDYPSRASIDAQGLVRALLAGTVGVRACGNEQPTICGVVMLRIQ